MVKELADKNLQSLVSALHSSNQVHGLTHRFYRYPARFHPDFAREAILSFSKPGEWILDPFMGGGTTIVEAVANNRKALGIDINSLSSFVTAVKTTPLSFMDRDAILRWFSRIQTKQAESKTSEGLDDSKIAKHASRIISYAIDELESLPYPRQKYFVRCALLRTGQWASEKGMSWPSSKEIWNFLENRIKDMFSELDEFIQACKLENVFKNEVTKRRLLLNRSIIGLEKEKQLKYLRGKIKLVVTSPPYPGVHIVYHRWQVRGRKESRAPYLIAGVQDGHYGSYYTLGSRTPTGLKNYFDNLQNAFASLKFLLHTDAVVVQLIAFSNMKQQLPLYLSALENAGYFVANAFEKNNSALPERVVPNRRWYAACTHQSDASREIMLVHRPKSKSQGQRSRCSAFLATI